MSNQQHAIDLPPAGHNLPSDHDSLNSKNTPDTKGANEYVSTAEPALSAQGGQRMEGVLGDAVLRFLRIRKGPKLNVHDPDAVGF